MRWGIDVDDARARIRHKRSSPPGSATEGERRAVFSAALEQFDELLSAGSQIGPAASPIPLFYSLSQAGRALTAAFGADGKWEISGHGLKFSLEKEAEIGDGIIKPVAGKSDAFSLVSLVTCSPALTSQVKLQEAWAAAPYMWAPTALGNGNPEPLQLTGETNATPHTVARLDGEVTANLVESTRTEELRTRLIAYPAAATLDVRGTQTIVPSGGSIAFIAWPGEGKKDQPLSSIVPAMIAGGAYFLQPGLGENDDAIAPLMVWWLILFALSSLARYHPAQWMAALDPSTSELAVPIERALREFATMMPHAVLHELERERSS